MNLLFGSRHCPHCAKAKQAVAKINPSLRREHDGEYIKIIDVDSNDPRLSILMASQGDDPNAWALPTLYLGTKVRDRVFGLEKVITRTGMEILGILDYEHLVEIMKTYYKLLGWRNKSY